MEEKVRMQLISSSIEYEEEEFYEEIQAPKFVDFTFPNHFAPDDRFWFCARVGCDLKHEEVMDPEAIDKNFVFRVMAARSPNVRFRRAINRKPLSESKKCPFSAPPKPTKSRLPRFALVSSSITKKLLNEENGKLRTPIAKVKPTSTPKARVKHVAAKYMTSPRKKKESSPNPNAFRSARNPTKMRVSLPKSKVIAKALVFNSPKKGLKKKKSEELCTPITKLCEGVKKLQTHSHRKGIGQKSLKDCTSKSKKLPLVNDLEIHRPFSRDNEENEISTLHIVTKVSEEKNFKEVQVPNVDEKGKEKDNVIAREIESKDSRVISGSDENEDKENGLNFVDIRNLNSEDLNRHNASVKPKVQSKRTTQKLDKTTKENCQVGSGKQVLKNRKLKTTNPKPFRLRTDERGVLKEATMVRQVNSTENSSTASENSQGTGNRVTDKASKKDESRSLKKDQPRIIKSRYKTSKEVEPKSEKSSRNTKLLFLQNQREIASNVKSRKLCVNRGTEIDKSRPKEAQKKQGKEVNDLESNASVAQRSATKGKWTGIIPREPKFHSLHKPKCCKKDKP